MREAPHPSVPETAPGRSTSIQRLIGSLSAGYRSVCGEGRPRRRASTGFQPRVELLEERELLSAVPLNPSGEVLAAEVGSQYPGSPDAQAVDAVMQSSLAELAWELQQQYVFSYPGSYYENEHGLGEKTLRSNTLNAWVGILPNGNILNMDKGKELLDAGDPAFHEDPSLLFNAQETLAQESAPDTGGEAASAAPSLQAPAWELQQQYRFRINGQLYFNEHKMSEKEFWSDTLNDWVIILPNGNIHRPGGGYPLLVAGDPAFYEDPSLLFNAEPPLPGVAPELLSRVQAAVSAELTVQIGEEAGALMEDYDAESQTLLTSVSVTNQELARIQGVQLFERSSFYIHVNDIEPILRRVMPALFPENLAEYITQQAALQSEEPGHIQDRILMQQSDYRRIIGGLVGYFESAMSDLLNLTMDRIARMNAGELSESNLMRDLREAVGRANISRYIGEIASFGIRIPSAEELYREGQRLFTEEQTLLQHIQSEQGRLQEIDNFRASFREWQLGHGQPDLSVFIGADRGRADNGYQGTLTAGEERRLGRAQRLAEVAMSAMFDRRIQMRVVPEGEPITDRLQYGGDGVTYLNVTAREHETAVLGVMDVIEGNLTSRESAEEGIAGRGITFMEETVSTEEIVRSAIEQHVTDRLNERLQSMTVEERAQARGLLRLKEDGRLDEYFASLFSGESNETVEAELSSAGKYSVYYLIDSDAVGGEGHAAMIMGSENEGWYYFSFGYGSTQGRGKVFTNNGNMEAGYYISLEEAHVALDRYSHFMRWDLEDVTSIRAAFMKASTYLDSDYSPLSQNCDDVASEIIRASGIDLIDYLSPRNTYDAGKEDADEFGSWNMNNTEPDGTF